MGRALFLLLAGSVLIFILFLPGNHTEAEDAFEYARLTEEGRGSVLFHPHHLLYLPLQKSVYTSAQALGYSGRAYYTARAVSMTAAAAAVAVFFLLACRLEDAGGRSVFPLRPVLATLGLLFSYGFLRYACEVEIYLPAAALALGALYAAVRASDSARWFTAGVVLAALALLMHVSNAPLALVVLPLCYALLGSKKNRAWLHLAAVLAAVGSVYLLVYFTSGFYRPPVDAVSEGWLKPGTLWKALVGLGQCLLSANFIFANDAVAERLQQMFPYRVFAEEIFTADHMPFWLRVTAPWTFAAALIGLGLSFGWGLLTACRKRRFDRRMVILLCWLAGTMLPTVLLEPSNPELWILVLMPMWCIFLWLSEAISNKQRIKFVLIPAIAMLGLHNLATGMGSVRSREGDYNFRKAEWILGHAGEGDVIHTADSFVFSFYLDYWTDAEVRNVNTQDWKTGERTFLFDDIFNHPASIGVRYPEFARKVDAVAGEQRPHSEKIRDDQFGGIWIVGGDESE